MANTWQGLAAWWLPASFDAALSSGDLRYRFTRASGALMYSAQRGEDRSVDLPVAASLGGRRHGVGFLVSIDSVDGIPLMRKSLIQARYAWSPEKNQLLLAPGCSSNAPESLEDALGLVLSPRFESRCLSCHGQPSGGSGEKTGGVHCEACHGPGSNHLAAIAKGSAKSGILNPGKLPPNESIETCARCHVGLARFSDPSPSDLLIANQVQAIRNSECFLQSGQAFSCITCHDPHRNASTERRKATDTCLGCHAIERRRHASICPVNQTENCVTCHMPDADIGPLHLVDHTIRVHPEQKASVRAPSKGAPQFRTQVPALIEYLRLITTDSLEAASAARARITSGQRFYTVAREMSVDTSAPIGGYVGRKNTDDLPPEVREEAAHLPYGGLGSIVRSGSHWLFLQRLPRDFRWQAEQLQQQAEASSAQGKTLEAIGQSQQSLMIYPQFLRALAFIGMTYVGSGNPAKGVQVLQTAARLYPADAGVQFALGTAFDALGDRPTASEHYGRAILLDEDLVGAYANLGYNQYLAGDLNRSMQTLRLGLKIDPLSAELNYDLSLALTRNGELEAATRTLQLARKLHPGLVERREARSERR
jgi:tetratricopeptide (TPR) repeat protein